LFQQSSRFMHGIKLRIRVLNKMRPTKVQRNFRHVKMDLDCLMIEITYFKIFYTQHGLNNGSPRIISKTVIRKTKIQHWAFGYTFRHKLYTDKKWSLGWLSWKLYSGVTLPLCWSHQLFFDMLIKAGGNNYNLLVIPTGNSIACW